MDFGRYLLGGARAGGPLTPKESLQANVSLDDLVVTVGHPFKSPGLMTGGQRGREVWWGPGCLSFFEEQTWKKAWAPNIPKSNFVDSLILRRLWAPAFLSQKD